jgi:hypothetical protein
MIVSFSEAILRRRNMRNIRWFVLGVSLAVAGGAWAQDAPQTKLKVLIDRDGNFRVFDAGTGKELPAQIQKTDGQPERKQDGDNRRNGDEKRRDEDQKRRDLEKARRDAEKALEEARREIEKLLQDQKKDPKAEPKRGDGKQKVIELELRDIIIDKEKKPGQPLTTDQKLDLILKQMAELRRDVDQIKQQLGGRGGPGRLPMDPRDKKPDLPRIEVKPGGLQLDDETVKRIMEIIKKKMPDNIPNLPGFPDGIDPDTVKRILEMIKKKADRIPPQQPPQADRNAEMQQRLDRMLREIEDIRREIQKGKTPR